MIHVQGQKVFTCFDAPHLLKSLRNNFMNPKLQLRIHKKVISWNDIKKTYDVDQQSNTTRAMVKITPKHIFPTNFEKMRVKYAAQVFSHSVAAAIKTASAIKQINSNTSLDTADFIENINNIFDALNSRIVNDPNPSRRPLSIFNNHTADILQKGIQYFNSVEVYEGSTKRNNIYSINGFEWTLKSIILLWNDLKEMGVKYLLTGFLNQDPLENFFSVIRNRGGYNPTPTVKQCRIAIQQNINIRLQMAIGTGNCEVDDSEVLDIQMGSEDNIEKNGFVENNIPPIEEQNVEVKENCIAQNQTVTNLNTLETCSNVYVAGYLAHSVEKKFKCGICSKKYVKDNNEFVLNEREIFLFYKDYSRESNIKFLKRPSEQFANTVSQLLQQFYKFFDKYKCSVNVTKRIENELKITLEDVGWFQENEDLSCALHKEYILKLFIKMNIFRCLKWISQKQTAQPANKFNKSEKPHRKVRILS